MPLDDVLYIRSHLPSLTKFVLESQEKMGIAAMIVLHRPADGSAERGKNFNFATLSDAVNVITYIMC